MTTFRFIQPATGKIATQLGYLIGNRKGNEIIIKQGKADVIGVRVAQEDEQDVIEFALKHNLLPRL